MRIAVFASGRGSNLRALVEYLEARGQARGGDVVLVASDRREAGAIDFARTRGIETASLAGTWSDAQAIRTMLDDHGVGLVALAGYLRLVPAEVVRAFAGAMVNIHPALLPAFGGVGMYGERVHAAVLHSGARISGPTVHFVSDEYDRGAIVAQWPVPVFSSDTPERLGARVLRTEHRLFPRAVDAIAAGRISLGADGRVRGTLDTTNDHAAFALLTDQEMDCAASMDLLFAR